MNQLKSIYNSSFNESQWHPIPIIARILDFNDIIKYNNKINNRFAISQMAKLYSNWLETDWRAV